MGRKRDNTIIDVISSYDERMLDFIWRWKAVNLASLLRIGCGVAMASTAYKYYRKLLEQEFVLTNPAGAIRKNLIAITRPGFQQIAYKFGELEKNDWSSTLAYEDYMGMAFTLGYWILAKDAPANITPGRLLECYYYDRQPSGYVKTKGHAPKSYCYIDEDDGTRKTWTVEVFHFAKAPFRYEMMAEFYNKNPSIDVIFCLVKDNETLAFIHEHLKRCNFSKIERVNYILLQDFIDKLWHVPIEFGSFAGLRVIDVIGPKALEVFENPSVDTLERMPFDYVEETLLSSIKSLTALRFRGKHNRVTLTVAETY